MAGNVPKSPLAARWHLIAGSLGLRVAGPISIDVTSGQRVDADVLVEDFGAARGMLLVTNADGVWPHRAAIVEAGYGFSVLSETT